MIWATKRRKRLINKALKNKLLTHIKEVARSKDIHIVAINCVEDHIHLIVSMNANQDLAKIVMHIKGESSHWVNKQKILDVKFEWQDDYIALSISKSQLPKVIRYINNQEEHHHRLSSQEEYDLFLKHTGFKIEGEGLKPEF